MRLESLHCPSCKRRFGLLAGTGKLLSEALPNPFDGRCLHCGTISQFLKTEIRIDDLRMRFSGQQLTTESSPPELPAIPAF
jgi:hypothetical protein